MKRFGLFAAIFVALLLSCGKNGDSGITLKWWQFWTDATIKPTIEQMAETAKAVESVLALHEDCAHLTPEQTRELNRYGKLVLFHSVDGAPDVFYRSPDLDSVPAARELAVKPNFLEESAGFRTFVENGDTVRVYSAPYRSKVGRRGVVRVMERMGDVEMPLRNLRLGLLLLAPLAVFGSAVNDDLHILRLFEEGANQWFEIAKLPSNNHVGRHGRCPFRRAGPYSLAVGCRGLPRAVRVGVVPDVQRCIEFPHLVQERLDENFHRPRGVSTRFVALCVRTGAKG